MRFLLAPAASTTGIASLVFRWIRQRSQAVQKDEAEQQLILAATGEYDAYRRQSALEKFITLPEDEQLGIIRVVSSVGASTKCEDERKRIREAEVARLVLEQYPDTCETFEIWRLSNDR